MKLQTCHVERTRGARSGLKCYQWGGIKRRVRKPQLTKEFSGILSNNSELNTKFKLLSFQCEEFSIDDDLSTASKDIAPAIEVTKIYRRLYGNERLMLKVYSN